MSGIDPALAEEQRQASAFNRLMGYRLEAWEPDRAMVVVALTPDHLNRINRVHGGVLAAILDTAMGYAGTFPPAGERRSSVTLSMTVNFIAAATEGRLEAVGRRVGGGRSVFFAEGEVRDEAGALLATATGTFRYLSAAPAPAARDLG